MKQQYFNDIRKFTQLKVLKRAQNPNKQFHNDPLQFLKCMHTWYYAIVIHSLEIILLLTAATFFPSKNMILTEFFKIEFTSQKFNQHCRSIVQWITQNYFGSVIHSNGQHFYRSEMNTKNIWRRRHRYLVSTVIVGYICTWTNYVSMCGFFCCYCSYCCIHWEVKQKTPRHFLLNVTFRFGKHIHAHTHSRSF